MLPAIAALRQPALVHARRIALVVHQIRLGQGKEKVKDFLRENPQIAQEIESKIRAVTIAKPGADKDVAEEQMQDVEPIFKDEL